MIDHNKIELLAKRKPNLITKTIGHFGSYGRVFGIGIRDSYAIDEEGISFGKYFFKTNKISNTQDMNELDLIEEKH